MDFDKANLLFRSDKIQALSRDKDGLRYLMLRSLSRKMYLEFLFQRSGRDPRGKSSTTMLREAYGAQNISVATIEDVIRRIYEDERGQRRVNENDLVDQLYRLEAFDWGGLHENSLERTIVDQYVKKVRDFDILNRCIENELLSSMRGYVLCSWYNHWTSIIIEDIFRDHKAVLPAVGLIKKIDFFLNGIPFDLKVTYVPEGYIKSLRRASNQRPELTLLKQWARKSRVTFASGISDSRLLPDLWRKADDHPSNSSIELIQELSDFRAAVLKTIRSDPTELIVWLYENQGVRRFDASNRLFLVLVDSNYFFDSWKLKRAKPLLESGIHAYLSPKISDSATDSTQ